jgi:DNA repair and recombination protein RAD54B
MSTNASINRRKPSNKKVRFLLALNRRQHKTWDGDGVVAIDSKQGQCTLYDDQGTSCVPLTAFYARSLGKARLGPTVDLSGVCGDDDVHVKVGGKEVQIGSKLDAHQFLSGKCFTPSAAAVEPLVKKQAVVGRMGFKKCAKPLLDPRPRHDPSIDGALVMPRPDASHQSRFNPQYAPHPYGCVMKGTARLWTWSWIPF